MNDKTYKEVRQIIIDLLLSHSSLTIDDLVDITYQDYKLSEREVKESIWELLEEKVITPDCYWDITN